MYEELTKKLREKLNFRGSPVAIALRNEKPDLDMLDNKKRFCDMLNDPWLNGKSFYTTSDQHACDGGAYHLGLKEMPEDMKNGEFLYKTVGLFGSARAARRFFSSNIGVEPNTVKYAYFSPLERANFEPDVVVIICNAKDGMRLTEASAYETGIGAEGLMGPICSTIVAAPFLTGRVVFCLADAGSRHWLKINDDEMIVGIPFERLKNVIRGLDEISKREKE